MRILYGVVGEGMGHATRSKVVLRHLIERGHEVEVVVSGRAHDLLARELGGIVRRIHGLEMVYADNTVKKRKTLLKNLEGINRGLPDNVAAWFKMAREFAPEVVISDFESWSYLFGQHRRLPVISVDNMQIINRCDHSDVLEPQHSAAFQLAKGIVKGKLPGCAHYLVSTFFHPPLRKDRTTLVPPILRDAVLEAASARRDDGHVLVYQSGESHGALVETLRRFQDTEFRVYGLRRDLEGTERDGNLTWRPFSQQGFIDDLASAKAVVAGGGFSLMSEAVYLGKPMLSVPLKGQFEQILNALWLERLGYGIYRPAVTEEDLGELLERAATLQDNLKAHKQDGNAELLATLDNLLAHYAAQRT